MKTWTIPCGTQADVPRVDFRWIWPPVIGVAARASLRMLAAIILLHLASTAWGQTAPVNDLFTNAATAVGFGGVYHASNRGYTREALEPAQHQATEEQADACPNDAQSGASETW